MDSTNNFTYGSEEIDFFPGTEYSEAEERIVSWLETKSITTSDPLQKKDNYYLNSKRKIDKLRSLRSISKSTDSETSMDSLSSLMCVTSLEKRKSAQIISEEPNFLKESITWKLKNRRRTAGGENIGEALDLMTYSMTNNI